MGIREIGQKLQGERKRQNLGLEDVYSSTKIGIDILKAMEEGNREELPHWAYTKGFIRNYARYLGLDSEELLQELEEDLEEAQESGYGGEEADRSTISVQKGEESSRSVLYTGTAVVLFLVLALLVYHFYLSPEPEERVEDPEPAVAEEANETAVEPEEPAEEEAEPIEEVVEEPAEIAAEREAFLEPGSIAALAEAVEDYQEHELRIVATEECWVRAEMNDEVEDVFVQPDEEIVFRFQGEGEFILGNAGGVTVFFNQQQKSLEADFGEVRVLNLP